MELARPERMRWAWGTWQVLQSHLPVSIGSIAVWAVGWAVKKMGLWRIPFAQVLFRDLRPVPARLARAKVLKLVGVNNVNLPGRLVRPVGKFHASQAETWLPARQAGQGSSYNLLRLGV